jgi:hypothetical protein
MRNSAAYDSPIPFYLCVASEQHGNEIESVPWDHAHPDEVDNIPIVYGKMEWGSEQFEGRRGIGINSWLIEMMQC